MKPMASAEPISSKFLKDLYFYLYRLPLYHFGISYAFG